MRICWNWQTGTFEGRVQYCVWVQVPLFAPILFRRNIMKEEFLLLLQSVQREGIDKLLAYIEKTDFFKAPASTRFHGNHEGGLLEHSLNVYHLLKEKLLHKPYSDIVKASDETIILITLLHDFCKANYYTVDYRNKKNDDGIWV